MSLFDNRNLYFLVTQMLAYDGAMKRQKVAPQTIADIFPHYR